MLALLGVLIALDLASWPVVLVVSVIEGGAKRHLHPGLHRGAAGDRARLPAGGGMGRHRGPDVGRGSSLALTPTATQCLIAPSTSAKVATASGA
jgi:hypothetical protein